jgi:hypothetical protein
MDQTILAFLVIGTVLYLLMNHVGNSIKEPNDPVEQRLLDNSNYEQLRKVGKTGTKRLFDVFDDIKLEPYGCFMNLKDEFFTSQVNRYASNEKIADSGTVIEDDKTLQRLILKIARNGFQQYAVSLNNKTFDQLTLHELGVLGKLAGYNYISLYKMSPERRGKVFFTYSPPLNTTIPQRYTQDEFKKALLPTDLDEYTLTPVFGQYTNEVEKDPSKQLSCGFPCNETFIDPNGIKREYMCGSMNYPTIKTPTRYSVYKITEI